MERHLEGLVLILALALLWPMWEYGPFGDWGLESGYYGYFNRVKHAVEEMP